MHCGNVSTSLSWRESALFLTTYHQGFRRMNCKCFVPDHLSWSMYPANIYLFEVNNRNTRKWCEICSTLAIKTPEQLQWGRPGGFIVNFEDISHFFLVFLLSSLMKYKNVFAQFFFIQFSGDVSMVAW